MKHERVVDFSTSGPAPLTFYRTYFSETGTWNGAGLLVSRLGRVWRSNFDTTLTINPPLDALAFLPDGREVHFTLSQGAYVPNEYNPVSQHFETSTNTVETLTKPGTDFHLQLADDSVYIFDSSGRLTSIQYRGGYTQTLTWDTNGKNTAVSDNLGRSISFMYGANGLLSELIDPDGRITKYTYVDKSQMGPIAAGTGDAALVAVVASAPHIEYALDTVIYPDSTPSDDSDNPRIRYHYDNTSFPYGLTSIVDERGVTYATWTYNSSGRVATSEHAGSVEHYAFSYDDVIIRQRSIIR